MILIDLGAGVALILLGVRFLRKGLDRFLGGRLIDWLRRMTTNRVSSLFGGMAVGAFSASSTGLSLLTAQVLDEGKIRPTNMLAVLLGGTIGITFLAHLVSFNLSSYAGLFLCAGASGFLFSKNQKLRGVGQCVLALGFIFLSMQFIGQGANAIGANHDLNVVIAILRDHPVLLTLLAALLAFLMQSSTASIGLGVGLVGSTTLRQEDVLPWVLGTNVGLAVTALVVCWGTAMGRRLGVANLIVKAACALLLATLFSVGLLSVSLGALSVWHLMPVWHTLFNLIAAVVALPFLRPLLAVAEYGPSAAQESETLEGKAPETFLDPHGLESPAIALGYATREASRMAYHVRLMLQKLALANRNRNASLATRVKNSDDRIDDLNQNIMLYLGQLGEELTDYDRKWQLTLLNFSNELETAGDVIEKNLCDAVIKQSTEPAMLTVEETRVLDDLFATVIRRIDIAANLVSDRNTLRAREFIAEKNRMEAACLRDKQARLKDFRQTERHGLYGTLCFLDMLEALQRINGHISSVAYLITSETGRSRRAKSIKRPHPAKGTAEEGSGASVSNTDYPLSTG